MDEVGAAEGACYEGPDSFVAALGGELGRGADVGEDLVVA